MARHVDTEVESKPVQQYNLTKLCGTVKEIHHGFSRIQDLSMPSKREKEGGREGGRKSGEEGSDICFPLPSVIVRPLVSGPSLATWSGVIGVAGTCSLVPPGCQGSHVYHIFEEEMCNATWWVERCGVRGGEVWGEG